jgi:hypothetical protein
MDTSSSTIVSTLRPPAETMQSLQTRSKDTIIAVGFSPRLLRCRCWNTPRAEPVPPGIGQFRYCTYGCFFNVESGPANGAGRRVTLVCPELCPLRTCRSIAEQCASASGTSTQTEYVRMIAVPIGLEIPAYPWIRSSISSARECTYACIPPANQKWIDTYLAEGHCNAESQHLRSRQTDAELSRTASSAPCE